MALRIDTSVIRGEIDNTERGRVRGKLWLVGRKEPVELDLEGDAWRDVAGTRLVFTNPEPSPQAAALHLDPVQNGSVGDITASRKVKVFLVPEDEWKKAYVEKRIEEMPTEWCNSLYLEWFSGQQGRCVVESADFEITVSDHEWELDEDEEGAQRMANMHAMREFLATVIQRDEPQADDDEDDGSLNLTEEQWEEQLKASDRLADASMEAYEKYGEDEDCDEKTAFVMGWDHLLEDMADAEEGIEPSESDSPEKKRRREWAEMMNQAAEEAEQDALWEEPEDDEEDDEDGAEGNAPHPLQQQAKDFLLRVMRDMRGCELDEERGDDSDTPADRFINNIMQVTGKLAAALGRRRDLEDPAQRGYILAITRRCLNWTEAAFEALRELEAAGLNASLHSLFESWRDGLQQIRNGISRLRAQLGGSPM